MTFFEAINKARARAARTCKTYFVVHVDQNADDETDSHGFRACAAASVSYFGGDVRAAVSPDGTIERT